MDELQEKILAIVTATHVRTGGNNGTKLNEFEELNLSIEQLWDLLHKMQHEKKIVIREGSNVKMIMLPK